ncbi:MAG: tagatose 1,6-diphosphate aldolase [Parvularculaceae bacterium]|nr:tagatose 1,6-diphosphate aldolase [Parvularculaceae bacterium]
MTTTLSAGKLWGLRRMADANGRFKMTAVDQRPPIKKPIAEKRGLKEAPWEDVAGFKELLIETLQADSSAMLLDPHFAYPRGVMMLSPAKGLILTLEDSLFKETPGGRLSAEIDNWSVEKIKRCGGDAVKVLAWHHPEADASVTRHQKDFVARVGSACAKYDIPYVFELLLYPLAKDAEQTRDYVEMKTKRPQLVVDSVATFAHPDYGVDLFKLESPIPADLVPSPGEEGAAEAQRWFDALGQAAGRPWVMLSAGAGMSEFRNILAYAYKAGASGYLAGRAIWAKAFQHFPDWTAIRAGLESDAAASVRELNALTDKTALPWTRHACYGEGGPRVLPADHRFRHDYKGFQS